MAVAPEIRDAEKAARIALLEAITEFVPNANSAVLVELAKAYNLVTATDAPSDTSKVRVGGFA